VTNSGSGGVGSGSYGDRLLALGGSAPIEPVAEEKSASRKRSRWGGLADDASTPVAVEPYNPLEPSADSLRAAQALLNGGVGGLVMPTATGYALPMPPSQLGFMVNPPPAAPAVGWLLLWFDVVRTHLSSWHRYAVVCSCRWRVSRLHPFLVL
jgi:hypothetical protein